MVRLLVATRNPHKAREFREILGLDFELIDLSAYPEIPETAETGKTFAENAILKAVAASKNAPGVVIGDDSGLEVDLLNGEPGIFSARYADPNATDEKNVEKLLGNLATVADTGAPRTARFRCVIALTREGKLIDTFEGIIEGTVVESPRGSNGFGYDPIFLPNGFAETLAELPIETKNRISHRARAAHKLVRHLTHEAGERCNIYRGG